MEMKSQDLDMPLAVGCFLLQFSVLDQMVTRYLEENESLADPEALESSSIIDRLDAAERVLEKQTDSKELISTFERVVLRARSLGALLKQITDTPLSLRDRSELKPVGVAAEDPVPAEPSRPPLLRELRSSVDTLREVIRDFQQITGVVAA